MLSACGRYAAADHFARAPFNDSGIHISAVIDSGKSDTAFGYVIVPAGDIDGDGYADLLIGARYALNGFNAAGDVTVIYGAPDNTRRQAVLKGTQDNEGFGAAMAGGADFNGDGYADVAIGSPFAKGESWGEGAVSIYFGSIQGLSTKPDLVLSVGHSEAQFGYALASGDVNGDGYADLLVGAPGYDGGRGIVFLFLGSLDGLQPTPAWSARGEQGKSRLGESVVIVPDFTGNGFSDIIVGEPGFSSYGASGLSPEQRHELGLNTPDNTHEGRILIYSGGPNPQAAMQPLSIPGTVPYARFGSWISDCGDVNGDGLSDIAVGVLYGANGAYRNGSFYMIYGTRPSEIPAALHITQMQQDWSTGNAYVSGVRDLNGDGFDDVIVGYAFHDNDYPDEGRICLYLGRETGLDPTPALTIDGGSANAWLGLAVAGVGDMNGDGLNSIAVSAAFFANGKDDPRVFIGAIEEHFEDMGPAAKPEKAPSKRPLQNLTSLVKKAIKEPWEERRQFLVESLPKLMQCASRSEEYGLALTTACRIGYYLTMRGDLENADRYMSMANHLVYKQYLMTLPRKRLHLMMNAVEALWTHEYILAHQGKAARAHHCHAKIGQWQSARLERFSEPLNRNHYRMAMMTEYRIATQKMQQSGQQREAEILLKKLLEQAQQRHYPALAGRISFALAELALDFEQYDDAMRHAAFRLSAPASELIPGLDDLQKVLAVTIVAECNEVVADDLMQLADTTISGFIRNSHSNHIMSAKVARAFLTHKRGDSRAALADLDRIVRACAESGRLLDEATARSRRAEIHYALGNPDMVEQDCLMALRLYRSLGFKNQELKLYELFGLSLAMRGQHVAALETLGQAFDLARTLNYPNKALRMLCHILEIHIDRTNHAGIHATLARIASLLKQEPGKMPKPAWRRYLALRTKALEMTETVVSSAMGSKSANQAPLEEAARTQPPEIMTRSARTLEKTTEIEVRQDTHVVLHPVSIITSVQPGETARGWFILFNPALSYAEGLIRVNGADGVKWNYESLAWHGRLLAEGELADDAPAQIKIPPGETAIIVLEYDMAKEGAVTRDFTLKWEGDSPAVASWQCKISDRIANKQLVNVSYGRANPFFYSTFYHEVYYRGPVAALGNIRAVASSECRIEYVLADTGRLLAVDANGNGEFSDVGDLIWQDLDNNGFPDLILSPERDVAAFEMRVYPASSGELNDSEITIDVYLQHDGQWEYQGTNILELEPGS